MSAGGIGAFGTVDPLEVRQLLAAPVNDVPGSQSTPGNMPLIFSGLQGNRLSISDADAGDGLLTVTLTTSHGTVSLPNSSPGPGVAFSEGDGAADGSLTFTGTIAEINQALAWVVFLPEQDYTGTAALSLTTIDQGPVETGPESDYDVISIEVTAATGTEQTFNVQDFGATGDGITDDAPAIRATIAAAKAAGGGTILFPPAIYLLDSFETPKPTAYFHLYDCEGLRFSGYGAELQSTSTVSSFVFAMNGARRMEFEGFSVDGQFLRSGSTIVQQSIGVFHVESTNRDSEDIRIADVDVTDAYFFLKCTGNPASLTRARDISVERCQFIGGFKGLSFQNNGDNFTARDFRTQGLVRSYFPYGVDSHVVEYTSTGGDIFTDCLIKAYQRDTTNIHVTVRILENTSQDAKLTLESQHNPWMQPIAARLENIRVHFDDTASIGPKSVRFSYFQDTPNPVQTSSSPANLFNNVTISGRARNATDFAVLEAQPGMVNVSWLQVLPALGLSSLSISEDQPAGTAVGMLWTTGSESSFTYALVPGVGGEDNSRFVLDGGELRTATVLNFEDRPSYSVRVRRTAEDGSFTDHVFAIQVLDVDEFDVGAISDVDGQPASVSERASRGTRVGITAFAADADGSNRTVTYSLIDDAGGRFAINDVTGVVSVLDPALLDFEQASSHKLTVRATSADGSTSDASFTIDLRDVDEFNVSAITDFDPNPSSVREHAPVGTTVGVTAHAVDADGTKSRITYSLWSSAGGRFAIDPVTGVVTVANSTLIDREAAGAWTITCLATSEDGSVSVQPFTIQLEDIDDFDVGQVFDLDPASNNVTENAAGGTLVGVTGFGIDLDATNSGVTYSLSNSGGGRFAINPVTGVVSVAEGATLDREDAASWTITVAATSQDGSSNSKEFTIQLVDINEHRVGALTDRDAAPNAVAENSAIGTRVGITGLAVDRDATQNTVTYSLFNTRNGRFDIDSRTGVVTVANGSLLDREAAGAWTITVLATGQDGSVSAQDFTIHVLDVDEFDVGQLFDLDAAANSVLENAAGGTLVGVTGFGIDLDATNHGLTYSLTNSGGGRFAINPVTGVVSVAEGATLDREEAASWTITVVATSQDGSSSTKDFTIQLVDVNEHQVGAVADRDTAPNTVAENAAKGTRVGITGFAADADVTQNTVTYSLFNTRNGRFDIDSRTGVVTVANGGLLDREAAGSWTITVLATGQDGSVSAQEFTIHVLDVDEFDVGQVFDQDSDPNSVSENASNGTTVGITAFAIDLDAVNNGVTYSLEADAGGRFAIDPATGVVTVANGSLLDREAAAGWRITVRATGIDGSVSRKAFDIGVTDVDDLDVGEVTDANSALNRVLENSGPGTLVGVTARAIDGDVTNNSVTYSLLDDAGGRFRIHPTTGVVSVAAGAILDFESETSHEIIVQAQSSDGSTSQCPYVIAVTNVFDAPRLELSNSTVAENQPSGTLVGTLGPADVETASAEYTLVSGAGGTDNSRFSIVGNQLRTRSPLNFESKSSYSIRVRMRSATGTMLDQVFTIKATDINESPTGVSLASSTIVENNEIGATAGAFQGIDPDREDQFTYTLVPGAGATDNARFTIDGNELQAAEVFTPGRKRTYSIRVRVTDRGGSSFERVLAIRVGRATAGRR